MRNPLRASAGKYVIEGSLAPKSIVETGIVNNVYDGYTPPTITGGTITYTTRLGVKYMTHGFGGSGTIVVSGSPRNSVVVGVKGGGGGGSYSYQGASYGGSGGGGGLGVGQGDLKIGNMSLKGNGSKAITVGGGGGKADPSGGAGGSSSALNITSTGGAGGYSYHGGGSPGGVGSASADNGRTIISSGGILDDFSFGGGGGAGGRWWEAPYGYYSDSTNGGAGAVAIRYRISK